MIGAQGYLENTEHVRHNWVMESIFLSRLGADKLGLKFYKLGNYKTNQLDLLLL